MNTTERERLLQLKGTLATQCVTDMFEKAKKSKIIVPKGTEL